MLTRQKVVLALLDGASQPVTRTVLVKLMFLLRRETDLWQDTPFYDFVPHKFGPFSFLLYRELTGLEACGFVSPGSDHVCLEPRTAVLRAQEIADLDDSVRAAVGLVLKRYGRTPQKELLRDVYTRYPWYASRSELTDLVPNTVPAPFAAELAVYTVGYEGKSVDSFFGDLLRRGIKGLLDVRANPVSRKYGFAKRTLADIAGKLGLTYDHFPELGISGEERRDLDDRASYMRLLDHYEAEMLPKQTPCLMELVGHLKARPSALVCMEKDVTCCHRSRLAKAAAVATGLHIRHLA